MPDDRNLFDDDSLLPDEEQAQTPGAARPPWERRPGAQPPAPQDAAPTPAPWELHPGAPEAAPGSEPASLDALRQQAGAWETWDLADEEAPDERQAQAPDEAGTGDLAWMSAFGTAADAAPTPPEEDDLSWLGEVEPGQEPPPSEATPAAPRKVDTDELPWLDDETFRRIPTIEPEDDLVLSSSDLEAEFPTAEQPAEPAEAIPDWLSEPFSADEAETASDSARPPAPPEETPQPRSVIRRLEPFEPSPPAEDEGVPDWLSEADQALDAVEASQPPALTYDEWERQQEEQEREARKTPEERLLESVPDWFEKLGDEPVPPPPPGQPQDKPQEPDFVPGWFMGLEEQTPEEAPDWVQKLDFTGDPLAAPAAPPTPAPEPDLEDEVPDWFKGIGAPGEAGPVSPTAPPFLSEPGQDLPAGEELPFADWMAGAEADRTEADTGDFVERFEPLQPTDFGPAPDAGSVPDWLREIELQSQAAPFAQPDETPVDDSLDWLADLSPEDVAASQALEELFGTEPQPAPPAPAPETLEPPATLAEEELEDLLGRYEAPPPQEPPEADETAWADEQALAASLDQALTAEARPELEGFFPEIHPGQPIPGLERLFEDETPPPGEQPREAAPAEPPDWVADLRPSDLPVTVRAAGAEVDVPQTPVVELPPRIHAFREKTLRELGEPPPPLPAAEAGALAGIAGALGRVDAILPAEEPAGPLSGVVVTREQQTRVKKLQALLAAAEEAEAGPAATPEPLEALAVPGRAPRRPRRARRFKPDRLVVMLLMLAALVVPFATDTLHFASDPPPLGMAGQDTSALFDALEPGDYVLIAFEYGPTAAGELDPLVDAVLRDAFVQGAVPLAISTNVGGALHAEAVFAQLAHDNALLAARSDERNPSALRAGRDYVLLGYLPGDLYGVRTLADVYGEAGTVHPAFATDLRGKATNLPVHAVTEDIALIVVAGEEIDDARTWAEQLKDVPVPKVALVTAALEPLIDPYLYEDGYAGYLAGVRDTYRYNLARNANARTPYTLPDDLSIDLPNPEEARWHSMALGAAAAAALIALGLLINLSRTLLRRRL